MQKYIPLSWRALKKTTWEEIFTATKTLGQGITDYYRKKLLQKKNLI